MDLTIRQQQQAIENAVNAWLWDNTDLIKQAVSAAVENWLCNHSDMTRQAINDATYKAIIDRL